MPTNLEKAAYISFLSLAVLGSKIYYDGTQPRPVYAESKRVNVFIPNIPQGELKPDPIYSPLPTKTPTRTPTITPTRTATATPTFTPSITRTPENTFIERPAVWGDAECRKKSLEALVFLKNKAPKHFQVVEEYIGIVECVEKGSGIYVWEKPPRFALANPTRDAGVIWLASVFAHEAAHSRLFNDYVKAHKIPDERTMYDVPYEVYAGEHGESVALSVQLDALQRIASGKVVHDGIR